MCIGRAAFGDDRCTCETVVDLRPKEMIMKLNKANEKNNPRLFDALLTPNKEN